MKIFNNIKFPQLFENKFQGLKNLPSLKTITIAYAIFFLLAAIFVTKGYNHYQIKEKNKFDDKAIAKADKVALDRYFALLDKHPNLKRVGDLNDSSKGTYEIFYDIDRIKAVRAKVFDRLFKKYNDKENASNQSRIGVVAEDDYWLWIRDAVKAPSGIEHTYNRIIMKNQLNGVVGAAVLPLHEDEGVKKVSLILIFRHATNSWELELPRGGGKPGETGVDIARRELKEETGLISEEPFPLSSIAADSGVLATIAPLFAGKVKDEGKTKLDKREAISGKYRFTIEEIEKGLLDGYMDVKLKNGDIQRANIRDSFLISALYFAKLRKIL